MTLSMAMYSKENRKVMAFCVGLYAVVFVGFWTKFTYQSTYQEYSYAQTSFMLGSGHLPLSIAQFIYRGYPSLDLVTGFLKLVSGAYLFAVGSSIMVVLGAIFAITIFLAYERIVGNSRLAFLSAVLLLTGDQVITQNGSLLWGSVLSFPLLALLLFFYTAGFRSKGRLISSLTVFVTLTLCYLPAAAMFLGFATVHFLLTRRDPFPLFSYALVFVLSNVMFSLTQFSTVILWVSSQISNYVRDPVATLFSTLYNPVRVASGGLRVPLWGQVTELFWVVVLVPIGLLASATLVAISWRRLSISRADYWLISGLVVSVLGAVLGGLLIANGNQLLVRLLEYVPFFTIPFLVKIAAGLKLGRTKLGLAVIFLILLILPLPTFLIDHKSETVLIDSQATFDSYAFASQRTQTPANRYIFSSDIDSTGLNLYFFPNATYFNEGDGAYTAAGANVSSAWISLSRTVSEFIHFGTGSAVYIWSPKMYSQMDTFYGVLPSDPNWALIQYTIGSGASLVYSNGNNYIFSPS